MGNTISGIIIQKSNFHKDTQLEECEKKTKDNFIIRFQRPTAVGLRQNCLRFFSDLINGVTKAKESLCNKETLPPVINVNGGMVKIQKQTEYGAEGMFTEINTRRQTGAKNVPIVFWQPPEKELSASSQSVSQTNDASSAPANGARAAPPLPSTVGAPALSTVQPAPVGKLAPPPPSIEGRPDLTSANKGVTVRTAESTPLPPPPPRISPEKLTALEQNHEPINLSPPPQNYQQPAPPAPPPPPVGKPITFNNGSAKSSVTSQVNEQNLNELLQAVKLKKTEINPKQVQQAGPDSNPQNALLNKVLSMRKDIEGDDKKPNDEDWD